MQTNENMVMIVTMVDKSVADEVASKVHDMTESKVSIFYGTGHSNERGFLGIPLNDEIVEVVCAVEQSVVQEIVDTISELGRFDELGKGYIVTIPSVTVMVPSPKEEPAQD